MQNQESSSALPTYAEAMRTQPSVHHQTINEYGATSPPHSTYPPTITSYPISTTSNYSQSMGPSVHPPYQSYDQQQCHWSQQQQQQQHAPHIEVQQPPTIHVIRHVTGHSNRPKSSHPKIIFAFILALIIVAAILRATIRHH